MTTSQQLLDEAYPIIKKLASSRSSSGAFAYYEDNDVYQEVWAMCLDAMERYNPEIGPIENYLVRHVSNRLKNLKRDKYFRPGSTVVGSGLARTRMNLINALSLSGGDVFEDGVLLCSASMNTNPVDNALSKETLQYVMCKLPTELLEPFGLLIGNNKVRGPVVEEICHKVAEILAERDNDVGE